MRVRAKANGNVLDVDDEQARVLIGAGIYEAVDAPLPALPAEKSPRYRRRDLKAED